MVKEMTLYITEELPFEMKFYTMLDLLITNQVESRIESFLFLGIFYLQILSSFFANQIGVFDIENSISDRILNYIERIVRLKDLFIDNYTGYKIFLLIYFIIMVILIFHFFISILGIKRSSFYSFNETFINYYIKGFTFIGYNIALDFCFSNFCFGADENNPNFIQASCSVKSSPH